MTTGRGLRVRAPGSADPIGADIALVQRLIDALSAHGVDVPADRRRLCVAAVRVGTPGGPAGIYWACRLALCTDHAQLAALDRAFLDVLGASPPERSSPAIPMPTGWSNASTRISVPEGAEPDPTPSATASSVELLRHRDVDHADDAAAEQIARLIAAIRIPPPLRPSRRRRPVTRSTRRIHQRATLRLALRNGGDVVRLVGEQPGTRAQPVALLVDISASMEPWADLWLRFAHSLVRDQPRAEVFTLGTRLTRVTPALRVPAADDALIGIGRMVPDWSGGTRLGEQLERFAAHWGQTAAVRGGTVVVVSDGWESGELTPLDRAMTRLRRLAARILWANPHAARPGYEPLAGGMALALGYVDALLPGDSVAAAERVAHRLTAA
jgi:uncharacterized protein with von Willebrand factor type A (vWA) domain